MLSNFQVYENFTKYSEIRYRPVKVQWYACLHVQFLHFLTRYELYFCFLEFSKILKIVSRVKNLDCLVFQAWRNWRHPKMGSASVFFWNSRKWPNGPDGTLRWVPPVLSQGSASKPAIFFILDISTSTQQQIILFR